MDLLYKSGLDVAVLAGEGVDGYGVRAAWQGGPGEQPLERP
jgi:hypothetical protein